MKTAFARLQPERRWLNRACWIWQRHLGAAALAALLLVCVAGWVRWHWTPALRAEQAALQQRLQARVTLPRPDDSERDPERAALRWIDALPPTEQRGAQVRMLIEAAAAAGVSLERADYAAQADAALPISKLHVTLPVSGSYAAVRGFVAQVLNQLPNAALEVLQLERSDTQSSQLRATARLVLLYRSDAR